jgi:hypothetical protein
MSGPGRILFTYRATEQTTWHSKFSFNFLSFNFFFLFFLSFLLSMVPPWLILLRLYVYIYFLLAS